MLWLFLYLFNEEYFCDYFLYFLCAKPLLLLILLLLLLLQPHPSAKADTFSYVRRKKDVDLIEGAVFYSFNKDLFFQFFLYIFFEQACCGYFFIYLTKNISVIIFYGQNPCFTSSSFSFSNLIRPPKRTPSPK